MSPGNFEITKKERILSSCVQLEKLLLEVFPGDLIHLPERVPCQFATFLQHQVGTGRPGDRFSQVITKTFQFPPGPL